MFELFQQVAPESLESAPERAKPDWSEPCKWAPKHFHQPLRLAPSIQEPLHGSETQLSENLDDLPREVCLGKGQTVERQDFLLKMERLAAEQLERNNKAISC